MVAWLRALDGALQRNAFSSFRLRIKSAMGHGVPIRARGAMRVPFSRLGISRQIQVFRYSQIAGKDLVARFGSPLGARVSEPLRTNVSMSISRWLWPKKSGPSASTLTWKVASQ